MFGVLVVAEVFEPGESPDEISKHAEREVHPAITVEIGELDVGRARQIAEDDFAAQPFEGFLQQQQLAVRFFTGEEVANGGKIKAAVRLGHAHRNVAQPHGGNQLAGGVEEIHGL